MAMKRSFFERLAGSAGGETFDSFDDELQTAPARKESRGRADNSAAHAGAPEDEANGDEGQLPVDVHQTAGDIVISAFVAGVRPDELGISISRDMVEISGSRVERDQGSANDYFTRELFWGPFSRTILLPQEVDVDSSSASAKDGLLTIILPRLDKTKQTKLRVKAG